jgi:serine/threonine protein kinase
VLKFLSRAQPAEVERFFREARFGARLNNPSIVQIYEAGEVRGQPFIAMQYINTGSAKPAVAPAERELAHLEADSRSSE